MKASTFQRLGHLPGLNRLTQKTDGRGKSLSFSYDKVGNLLSKTNYQGSTTNYIYNAANRLVMLSNPDYLQVDYQHDPAGRLLSHVTSAGARTTYQYDANGWLSKLSQYDAANALISDASYSRDRVGNILTRVDGSGTTTYIYDALYRLQSADAPGTANDEQYSYDRVGNRKTRTLGSLTANSNTRYYKYVAGSNRLADIRIGSVAGTIESGYTHDNEGRLTNQTGVGAKTIAWDAKGRAKSLGAESYTYDPMDYRIGRSGGALGSLDYFLEGEHLESVYQSDTLKEKYFRGASTDELIAGYLTETDGKQTPTLYHHDGVNSVSAVSGHNGGTLQSLSYQAFGPTQSSTGTSPNRLKYTGREDDGTGLYYYRARYYDPSIGRFISEDPLGYAAGINFYAYCNDDPVNCNDPMGLWSASLEAYAGVGGGISAAYKNGTFELTGRVGVGLGAGFQYEPKGSPSQHAQLVGSGYIARTFTTFQAEVGAGPVGIGGGVTYRTGNAVTTSVGGDYVEVSGQTLSLTNEVSKPYFGLRVGGAYGTEIGSYSNWGNSTPSSSISPSPAKPVTPSVTWDFITQPSGGASSGNQSLQSFEQLSAPGAAGGFLLYPNKSNTNMMQSVYQK